MGRFVNLYVDINPITNKIFYVGVGNKQRVKHMKRNRFHREIVNSLPNKNFIRRILYENIAIEKAWRIERQIIKKCGRLVHKTGYLSNIHDGGPLPMEDAQAQHWLKGKKIKDMLPNFKNPRANKTYDELYGDRKYDIISRQVKNRNLTIQKRIQKYGKSAGELFTCEVLKMNSARRKMGIYTPEEVHAFKRISEYQRGKTMKERLKNPNYVDCRKGKTAKEIYGENYMGPHNKGKTAKNLYGENYIDPRAHTFFIKINDEEPIFCESESDFCKKFNTDKIFVYKLKKNKSHTVKRQQNSKHKFPHKAVLQIFFTLK